MLELDLSVLTVRTENPFMTLADDPEVSVSLPPTTPGEEDDRLPWETVRYKRRGNKRQRLDDAPPPEITIVPATEEYPVYDIEECHAPLRTTGWVHRAVHAPRIRPRQRKHVVKGFDSTLGYPGEGPSKHDDHGGYYQCTSLACCSPSHFHRKRRPPLMGAARRAAEKKAQEARSKGQEERGKKPPEYEECAGDCADHEHCICQEAALRQLMDEVKGDVVVVNKGALTHTGVEDDKTTTPLPDATPTPSGADRPVPDVPAPSAPALPTPSPPATTTTEVTTATSSPTRRSRPQSPLPSRSPHPRSRQRICPQTTKLCGSITGARVSSESWPG